MKPYQILREESLQALENKVNDLCIQGYDPLGNIFTDGPIWCQTMYKPNKVKI